MTTQINTADATALDRSLVSGMAWTAATRWIAQAISWIATLYAARRLVPADYGLVAMGTLPIGLMRMVEDFGLDSVLVQNRTIDTTQQSRLAGLAVLVGISCTAIFIALSNVVAQFFHEPNVAMIVSILSTLFIFDALQIVPKAGLQRNLEFRRLALVGLFQTTCTALTLVIAIRLHLGYWSLILNSLVGALSATLLLVWWHPYALAWPRELRALSSHLKQGWRVLMTRATWYAYSSADQTIIGKTLGKDSLGVYSFATTFANLPIQEITSIVTRVVPGIFSQVQQQQTELRRYFLVLTEFISYLAFPIAAGIALTADLAMPVILGPQWDAVVLPLRILCIYSAFYASQILVSHVLTWTGQFRAVMWCSLLTAVALPLGLMVAVKWGLPAIAWTWAIVFPLTNIPPLVLGFRTIGISFATWLRAMGPALIACLVMAIVVMATRIVMPTSLSVIVRFVSEVAVGAIAYTAVLLLAFRPRLMAILDTVRSVRR